LDISCCDKLTDASINSLVSSCALMESVKLFGCPNISDSSLTKLSTTYANSLQLLDISGCKITDGGFLLVSNLQKLSNLSIAQNEEITIKTLEQVAEKLPVLNVLDLYNCKQMSEFDALMNINTKSKLLQRLRYPVGRDGCVTLYSGAKNIEFIVNFINNRAMYSDIQKWNFSSTDGFVVKQTGKNVPETFDIGILPHHPYTWFTEQCPEFQRNISGTVYKMQRTLSMNFSQINLQALQPLTGSFKEIMALKVNVASYQGSPEMMILGRKYNIKCNNFNSNFKVQIFDGETLLGWMTRSAQTVFGGKAEVSANTNVSLMVAVMICHYYAVNTN